MNHTCIDADVWCKWEEGDAPVYRVYVDDEMLTERTFIWEPKRHYIREHIEVYLDAGWHEVRIVNCSGDRVNFVLGSIAVNGQPAGSTFLV